MQTDTAQKESEMLDSSKNSINSIEINEVNQKKSLMMPPKCKWEPRDDDQQAIAENISNQQKLKNSINKDKQDISSNDVLNIIDTSSDEDVDDGKKSSKDRPLSSSLKKEEQAEIKMLDEQEEMMINDEDDCYTNGSNEQFPFNSDENEQGNDFLDNDTADNPLAEFVSEDGAEGTEGAEGSANEADVGDNSVNAEDDEDDENTNKETDQNPDNNSSEENVSTGNENSNDDVDNNNENTDGSFLDPNESVETDKASETKSITEDVEKETESESLECKRPASRESTTSTTSNSSERTLTIRSASDLNKLVMSANDAVVKKEKISADSEQLPEKPHIGLSILNPSQLGASMSSGGENLLQNMNFSQPSNQMNMACMSGQVPSRCDVCDTQFPDNVMLEEHKANSGHYKCHMNAECAPLVFPSIAEVSNHQQTIHGIIQQSPVQQLAHQVQSLPITYQMDQQQMNSNFSQMQQFQSSPSQVIRPSVPPSYSPQQNSATMRAYNMQAAPRYQMGAVRGVPMPVKRAATALPQTRMMPIKRGRSDYSTRNGDTDCKVVSIQKPDNTDDVVAQLSKSITITARQNTQKKNDTAAVTNMLANRGITVSSVSPKQNRNSSAVTMLNLNSAVSLIPTNNSNNKQQIRGRQSGPMSSASGMQTVDLTGPDIPRNRQVNRTSRFQCQICDRTFFNQEQLNQHMITHRNGARKQLPYKCNQCTAQYPTQQGLQQHKQTFHRESIASTNEMIIPIVDLKQPGAVQKLNAMGIHHMIPLNALGTQMANGTFGIPVLPLSSDRNVANNLSNLAVNNILPVGPLKTLGR